MTTRKYFGTNIFSHLKKRNLLYQMSHTELLDNQEDYDTFIKSKPKVYIGFDPTAEAIHLGNLLGVFTAMRFCKFGISPVFLLGGGTAKIGDPSGKKNARKMLELEQIDHNLVNMKENILSVVQSLQNSTEYKGLTIGGEEGSPSFINNDQFYSDLSLIDFLRDTGSQFRMGQLLSRETVKKRLKSNEGLSLSEFLYQTLQGNDFLQLFKNQNVRIQLGGQDQWGNMIAGQELVKKATGEEVISLTFPLLTAANGEKFGKSEGNALFLDERLTKPEKLYNYLVNTCDTQVESFLTQLTFLEYKEIAEIMRLQSADPGKRMAQRLLSDSLITSVFGDETTKRCRNNSRLFSASLKDLDGVLEQCNKTVIEKDYSNCFLSKFCVDNKILPSKAQFKRLCKTGSVKVNDKPIKEDSIISEEMLYKGKFLVMKTGKKKINIFEMCSRKRI